MVCRQKFFMLISLVLLSLPGFPQKNSDPGLLTIDLIYNSGEFQKQYPPEIQWINGGESYIVNEPSVKTAHGKILYGMNLLRKSAVFMCLLNNLSLKEVQHR